MGYFAHASSTQHKTKMKIFRVQLNNHLKYRHGSVLPLTSARNLCDLIFTFKPKPDLVAGIVKNSLKNNNG